MSPTEAERARALPERADADLAAGGALEPARPVMASRKSRPVAPGIEAGGLCFSYPDRVDAIRIAKFVIHAFATKADKADFDAAVAAARDRRGRYAR
jgi:hypothetical protein